MAEPTLSHLLPHYDPPPRGTIPYFHADLNMPPQKAAGILNKVAQAHSKGGRGKGKGKVKHTPKMPADGRGARVFGGKK